MARTPDPAAPRGPRLNLPLFLLALFGLLVVVHLWVQSRAGFAFGCTGVGDAASGAGCAEVTSSAYSRFLGANLLVWGGLFYVVVAGLRAGVAALKPPTSDTLRTASLVVTSIGFLFVLYLIYVQAFILGAFCTLCLVSALTVTTLLVLHLVERVKGPGPAVAASVALRPYAIAAVALLVLAGADVMLSDRADAPAVAREVLTSGPTTYETAECHYDLGTPRLPAFDRLITMQTPFHGSPDAPVRMLKIFDPNCPHCRHAHEVLEDGVMPEVDGAARLFYQPHALWEHSIPQIQALWIANEEGKFFEMLEQQFEYQQAFAALHRSQQGPEQVTAALARLAEEIGMDGEAFSQEIEAGKYVGVIQENRQLLAEQGVRSVPRLVIEGRVMASTNEAWTPQCIGQLVEVAAEQEGVAATPEAGAVAPPPADS